MTKDTRPVLVAINCLAFNHGPYIKECLEGFVMQKTDFRFVAIVHEDASTDDTARVIREYAEKYPEIIKPVFETENQYSKGKVIDAYNYDRARGRYIAVCEGDDYWTDPYKLQKQVDWMDAHPNYSICFHRVKHRNIYTYEERDDKCQQILKNQEGVDISIRMLSNGWYTQPLSSLFRVSMYDRLLPHKYKYYRDAHEIFHLMKVGKCRLMNFYGGVRNVHAGGVASMISRREFCEKSLPIDREFYWKTLDKFPKSQYISTLEESVRVYAKDRPFKALRYALIIFFLTRHPHSLIRNMKVIRKELFMK